MIKKIVLSTLLLSGLLQAQILDAKQVFNKTTTKVQKEEVSFDKSFYGITKIDESSITDIVSRFDGYITKLNANKKYMTIKKDKDAKISIDGISEKMLAKVDFIYPIFDEKTKTVDVRFVLDNKDLKLVPSMFGKVDINIKKDVMLTLPKTAVLKKANDYYVFKPLANGEFKPMKIEAKRVASNKYEILGGLEQNDEVINNALFLLDSDATTNALYKSDDENW